jgi:hypothetical protein
MSDPVGPVAVFVQPKLPRVKFMEHTPGERYQPCNGTEGEYFHAMWCEECERDKVMSGQATQEQADADPGLYCQILNNSFHDEGVAEWVIGKDGQPCCTAFVPVGQAVPYRCPNTPDLFERATGEAQ